MFKNRAVLIIGIFLMALIPRLTVVYNLVETPVNDAAGYDELAMNVINGKGFSSEGKLTSWREPLYPFFLASTYCIFGHNYKTVRIIQAIMGALICVGVFFIGRALFDTNIALLGAVLVSFNPAMVKICKFILSENLFNFLFVISVILLIKALNTHRRLALIGLGFILGLASLTRSMLFLFPFFLFLFLKDAFCSKPCNLRIYVFNGLIMFTAFSLTILPWTLRNWKVHHKIIPISCRTGNGMYLSYVLKNDRLFEYDLKDPVVQKAATIDSEYERSDYLMNETIKFVKNNPRKIFRIELLKILYFLSPFDWEILGYSIYNFMYAFMLPFFIFGVIIGVKAPKQLIAVWLPILYFFLMSLLTFGSARFRLPIEPCIAIIGAFGMNYLAKRSPKKYYFVFIVCAYLLLNVFLYFNSPQIKGFLKPIFVGLHIW